MVRRFARPYARAIIEVAGSAEKANALRGELMRFEAALRESPELRNVYANPGIDMQTKLDLTKTLASRMKLSELAARAAEVLVRFNRMNDVGPILEAMAAYVNEALGIARIEVRSAKILTPDEMTQLATTLGRKVGKKVELDVTTDPALLGGFVARIGSEVWDASVSGKISRFKESLT
ncbi:MAG TPA: ATP synthase F1 subunit delta [Thermoanaerobaculia bacterium]|nr:ATP synthase F1 subunit delta [Thermoanaerobaculia bacterium]